MEYINTTNQELEIYYQDGVLKVRPHNQCPKNHIEMIPITSDIFRLYIAYFTNEAYDRICDIVVSKANSLKDLDIDKKVVTLIEVNRKLYPIVMIQKWTNNGKDGFRIDFCVNSNANTFSSSVILNSFYELNRSHYDWTENTRSCEKELVTRLTNMVQAINERAAVRYFLSSADDALRKGAELLIRDSISDLILWLVEYCKVENITLQDLESRAANSLIQFDWMGISEYIKQRSTSNE